MDWRTLQVETEGLKLIDLLDSEFVNYINSEFVDKKIEVTNIQISVVDMQIDENSDDAFDLITLMNKSFKDNLLKRVIVNVNTGENLDKILAAINKMEK